MSKWNRQIGQFFVAQPPSAVVDRRSMSSGRNSVCARLRRITAEAAMPQNHSRGRLCHNAFTLVELMISIAIALLLIVGINKVFQISSQTVGAGQALGEISRNDRSAHTTIYADLKNAVTSLPKSGYTQSPALFIASSNVFAFRNAADQQSDNDQDPSTINNGTGNTPVDPVTVSDRSHRVDIFGFLAQGDQYARQTANNGQYYSPTTSSQAWLWYGHLGIPNNASLKSPTAGNLPFAPGQKSNGAAGQINDNNFLASDWILGRVAMLLVPSASIPAGDYYVNAATATSNPLGYDAVTTDVGLPIYASRYDIVNTSLSAFLALEDPTAATAAAQAAFRDNMIWNGAVGGTLLRYNANPFVAKPLNSAAFATATPIFIRSCAHFIVEYAGDYVTQDNVTTDNTPATNKVWGNIQTDNTGNVLGSDGTIDYVVDKSADPSQTNPSLWVQKIRWYGFPRSTTGGATVQSGQYSTDVVPLRDIRNVQSPWERVVPTQPAAGAPYTGASYANSQYVCSWGSETTDPLPKMIRITIALDDPNGRLASPQFFEYVIDLTQ